MTVSIPQPVITRERYCSKVLQMLLKLFPSADIAQSSAPQQTSDLQFFNHSAVPVEALSGK